jgi:hypothetical protein
MNAKRLVIVCGAAFISVLTSLAASQLLADKGAAKPIKSPLTEAAWEAYKCTSADSVVGKAGVEDLYRWSKRVMECESVDGFRTATADHAARMREMHAKYDMLAKAGRPPGSAFALAATEFYLIEAEKTLKDKP